MVLIASERGRESRDDEGGRRGRREGWRRGRDGKERRKVSGGGLGGKECERKEGREERKEGTRVRVHRDTQSQKEGGGGLDEVCLVFVPAGGTLAECVHARPRTGRWY